MSILLGDVAAARLYFEAGALAGDAACLTAVGTTYDPRVLNQRGLKGVYADPNKATEWYQKALQSWLVNSPPAQ